MTRKTRNLTASIHQRLKNKADSISRPFNELLQRFIIERFIYRLSKSPHAEKFILKGALMFAVWSGSYTRPTRDIDLLGKTDNDLKAITVIMRDVCKIGVEADGLEFIAETLTANRITEDAKYEGVRIHVQGAFGKSPIKLQIDIGFGDIVVPEPRKVSYPALLDFPAPELNGYTMESTIAEKYHAMAYFGITNSRMKDFYNIWMLSRVFEFKGDVLSKAIFETFNKRNSPLDATAAVFDDSFASEKEKISQWGGFLEKAKLDDAPEFFQDVVSVIKLFIHPVVSSLAEGIEFKGDWIAPGPWKLHNRKG